MRDDILRKPLPKQLTERVGAMLFVASQTAQTLANARLEPLGLSARGFGVLTALSGTGRLTQIELATQLAIDRTAMVYLLDELEAAGLVQRVRNPNDRRSFQIHLTALGRQRQTRAARALKGAADELLEPLDEDERAQFRELLVRIAQHWQHQL